MTTTSEKLADAKKELHSLLVGTKARVFVDQNGERIEYTSANSAKLRQYIGELEAIVDSSVSHPGPARVFF